MPSKKQPAQECYYVLLNCERTATAAELKKGYRKAALKWHPDKNADNVEVATEKFKEVQNAYQVLSDPTERAWYDTHRDSILRGGVGAGRGGGEGEGDGEYQDETVADLMNYFSTSCFYNFSDEDGCFYQVYREVFAKLDQDEEGEENEGTYHRAAPCFGDSCMEHEDVAAFYREWSNFVTLKQFHNADKYDVRAAPDRWNRRAMEAENKKHRSKARKQYIDTVVSLAAFIKKRDPRVKAMAAEAQKRREHEEREAATRKEEAKVAAAAAADTLRRESRAAAREREAELREAGLLSDSEEEDDPDDYEDEFLFECMVVIGEGAEEETYSGYGDGAPFRLRPGDLVHLPHPA